MDMKFTTKAQDALGASVRIAAAQGNAQVEPLHILDSLLQQGEGIAGALLDAIGVDRPALTREIRAGVEALPSASGSTVAAPQLSGQSYAVLQAADTLAKERGDESVSSPAPRTASCRLARPLRNCSPRCRRSEEGHA